MFGQFTGKHKSYGGLNFPRRQRGLFVVGGKLPCLAGDPIEDIVDEGIHNGHSLFGNPRVGMDLFQNFVNVRRVRFDAFLRPFLVTGGLPLQVGGEKKTTKSLR
jgi:hypothetical protein